MKATTLFTIANRVNVSELELTCKLVDVEAVLDKHNSINYVRLSYLVKGQTELLKYCIFYNTNPLLCDIAMIALNNDSADYRNSRFNDSIKEGGINHEAWKNMMERPCYIYEFTKASKDLNISFVRINKVETNAGSKYIPFYTKSVKEEWNEATGLSVTSEYIPEPLNKIKARSVVRWELQECLQYLDRMYLCIPNNSALLRPINAYDMNMCMQIIKEYRVRPSIIGIAE